MLNNIARYEEMVYGIAERYMVMILVRRLRT